VRCIFYANWLALLSNSYFAALERLAFKVRRENISWDIGGRHAERYGTIRSPDLDRSSVVAQAEPDGNSIEELITQAPLYFTQYQKHEQFPQIGRRRVLLLRLCMLQEKTLLH
jgi:hypothetical protein